MLSASTLHLGSVAWPSVDFCLCIAGYTPGNGGCLRTSTLSSETKPPATQLPPPISIDSTPASYICPATHRRSADSNLSTSSSITMLAQSLRSSVRISLPHPTVGISINVSHQIASAPYSPALPSGNPRWHAPSSLPRPSAPVRSTSQSKGEGCIVLTYS